MRRIALLILSALLLSATSVTAQTPAPTTSTPLRELADTVDAIGAQYFVLVIVVIIVLVVAVRGLAPLLGALKDANESRDKLQERLFDSMASADAARERAAIINERTVNRLEAMESGTQAEKGRAKAVESIKDAITTDGARTRNELAEIAVHVDEAKRAAERAATTEDVRSLITPVVRQLNELSSEVQAIQRKRDTGPLPPLPETVE